MTKFVRTPILPLQRGKVCNFIAVGNYFLVLAELLGVSLERVCSGNLGELA